MGQVINLDNSEGTPPAVLTDTGSGGFVSAGYLRDRPARSYLDEGETARFVLTNRKKGIAVNDGGDTERFRPDDEYRTIVVASDRRLFLLVGGNDGDRSIVLQFADIDSVDVESGIRNGTITVTCADGTRYEVYCSADGIDTVADYLAGAASTWVHVESVAEDVTRHLVEATQYRDDGEYDDAEAEIRTALGRLSEARERATTFVREWSGDAVLDRLDHVEARCKETLADVRVGRARTLSDVGERRWRDDEYERAHDAYERARDEYEAVLELDPARVDDRDSVREEYERTERVITQLEESPLRKAIEADRAAADADDPADAADHWEDALDQYQTALELDWGADERRFAGDPDQIRDRLAEVATEAVSARRSAATNSLRAGDWYLSADQHDAARDAFETARRTFEQAVETARDVYPEAVDHLETELDAVERRIERLESQRGEEGATDQESASQGADEPDLTAQDGGFDETGLPDGRPGDGLRSGDESSPADAPGSADDGPRSPDGGSISLSEDSPESPAPASRVVSDEAEQSDSASDFSSVEESESDVAERLRTLDREAFLAVVEDVLSKTGWTVESTAGATGDLLASKSKATDETAVVDVHHRTDGRPVGEAAVEEALSLYRSTAAAEAALLVTSAGTDEAAKQRAQDEPVKLFDEEFLSAVIEAEGMDQRLGAPSTDE